MEIKCINLTFEDVKVRELVFVHSKKAAMAQLSDMWNLLHLSSVYHYLEVPAGIPALISWTRLKLQAQC